MRTCILERGAERHGEHVARLFRRDDSVDEAAGARITSVELVLVVFAHLVDRLGDVRRERLVALFRFFDRGPVHGLDG